jgi:stage V sporulation protein B
MDKVTEMGKTSAFNSLQLFLGTSISTIIQAVGAIVLGYFILPGDYGLYVVALIPMATLSLFLDWGISSALIRYIAKYRVTNEGIEQRKVIVAGLIFLGITGLLLTIISFLLAGFFATTIYQKPASTLLITLASVTILSGALTLGVASVFTGFEKMKLNSYLVVISAVVQCVLGPSLVYLGYGAMGAIIGYTSASVLQAVIAILFLYFFIFKKLPIWKINKSELFQTIKSLLKYGIPLGIGGVIGNLGSPVFSFLMASYVNEVMIGNYKIASNFLVLLGFITTPISTVLFPAFSKLDPLKENNLLKSVFATSVKYTVLLLVPATMAMIVLATPLIGTLYGAKYPDAPPFLALMAVFYLLSLIGLRSMGGLLSATGETRLLMKMSILSLLCGIPTAFLLVPSIGIIGMIVGLSVAALPGTFVGLYHIWKRYGAKADFAASAKTLLASTLATVTVYLFLVFVTSAYLVLLVIGVILFLVVYMISVPLLGAINQSDVHNLRTMFSSLGIISRLIEIPLRIIEKLLKIRN